MLCGAATPVWSRRRRGGDQNLDPDGSTCSRDANERASESWFMVRERRVETLTTVKVAATTIRTCLRTEYLREGPRALSPADCWDHEGSMLVREKVVLDWLYLSPTRVRSARGRLATKLRPRNALGHRTSTDEARVAQARRSAEEASPPPPQNAPLPLPPPEPPPNGTEGQGRPAPPPLGGEPEPGLTPTTLHRAAPRWPAGFPVLVGTCQFGTAWAGLRLN